MIRISHYAQGTNKSEMQIFLLLLVITAVNCLVVFNNSYECTVTEPCDFLNATVWIGKQAPSSGDVVVIASNSSSYIQLKADTTIGALHISGNAALHIFGRLNVTNDTVSTVSDSALLSVEGSLQWAFGVHSALVFSGESSFAVTGLANLELDFVFNSTGTLSVEGGVSGIDQFSTISAPKFISGYIICNQCIFYSGVTVPSGFGYWSKSTYLYGESDFREPLVPRTVSSPPLSLYLGERAKARFSQGISLRTLELQANASVEVEKLFSVDETVKASNYTFLHLRNISAAVSKITSTFIGSPLRLEITNSFVNFTADSSFSLGLNNSVVNFDGARAFYRVENADSLNSIVISDHGNLQITNAKLDKLIANQGFGGVFLQGESSVTEIVVGQGALLLVSGQFVTRTLSLTNGSVLSFLEDSISTVEKLSVNQSMVAFLPNSTLFGDVTLRANDSVVLGQIYSSQSQQPAYLNGVLNFTENSVLNVTFTNGYQPSSLLQINNHQVIVNGASFVHYQGDLFSQTILRVVNGTISGALSQPLTLSGDLIVGNSTLDFVIGSDSSPIPWLIVGPVIGAVALVLVVAIGVIVWRRRNAQYVPID